MSKIIFGPDRPLPKDVNPRACPLNTVVNSEGHRHTVVSIGQVITEVQEYLSLLAILHNAQPGDTMDMYINSPGGNVWTNSAITNAMLESAAWITTIGRGTAASCGAWMWCTGDQLVADDWCDIMFHMSSHQDDGDSKHVMDRAEETIKYMEHTWNYQLHRGLLLPEEHTRLINHEDVYVPGKEMQKRILTSKGSGKVRQHGV